MQGEAGGRLLEKQVYALIQQMGHSPAGVEVGYVKRQLANNSPQVEQEIEY